MVNRPPPAPAAPHPAGGAEVKAHNLMLAWRCIRDEAPIGRVGVAGRTGLSKGSMTALSQQLIDLGLVKSAGEAMTVGRGRRAELLVPDGARQAVAAVQLRADDLVAGAMDLGGRVRWQAGRPHARAMGEPGVIADDVAALAGECQGKLAAEGCELTALRLVVAAPLWGEPPIIPAAVDFGWQMADFAGLVAARLRAQVPIRLMNDATAALIAEYAALPYRASTLVYLKSSTGIGGAVWAGGQVLPGAHGMAFEPGHLVVDPAGPECGCGQRGCLAAVAGPEVVLARSGLGEVAAASGIHPALAEFAARHQAGDPAARAAGAELTGWIARAVTAMRILFDPDLIVLGGYWASFAQEVRARLASDWASLGQLFASLWRTDLVRAAQVGERAAIQGALTQGVEEEIAALIGRAP